MTRRLRPGAVRARSRASEPRSFWFRARNRLIVSTVAASRARDLLEVGCGIGRRARGAPRAFPELRLVGGEPLRRGARARARRLPRRRARRAGRARAAVRGRVRRRRRVRRARARRRRRGALSGIAARGATRRRRGPARAAAPVALERHGPDRAPRRAATRRGELVGEGAEAPASRSSYAMCGILGIVGRPRAESLDADRAAAAPRPRRRRSLVLGRRCARDAPARDHRPRDRRPAGR